jgi:hypothetical protein
MSREIAPQIPPADNGRGSDELQNQPREDWTPLICASRRRQDGVNLLSGNAKEAMSEDGAGDSRSDVDLELTRGRSVGKAFSGGQSIPTGRPVPLVFGDHCRETALGHYGNPGGGEGWWPFDTWIQQRARYFRDITHGTMVVIWTDHAALTWVEQFHQADNMYLRWIVELAWYKPWRINHVAGKLNEVAASLSRKREGRPEQEEAFNKKKLCHLGE